jgi:hypothetical protein
MNKIGFYEDHEGDIYFYDGVDVYWFSRAYSTWHKKDRGVDINSMKFRGATPGPFAPPPPYPHAY